MKLIRSVAMVVIILGWFALCLAVIATSNHDTGTPLLACTVMYAIFIRPILYYGIEWLLWKHFIGAGAIPELRKEVTMKFACSALEIQTTEEREELMCLQTRFSTIMLCSSELPDFDVYKLLFGLSVNLDSILESTKLNQLRK